MIEIRFHGRGGQGAVVASKILADAAFREGKYVQSFPQFGVERRGAPVTAFLRIGGPGEDLFVRSHIYEPDHLIILDSTLLQAVDVFEGLKPGGIILVNSTDPPKNLDIPEVFNVATVDASQIAVKHKLGSPTQPIVNTAILGAFVRVAELVTLNSLLDAIEKGVPMKREENKAAAKEAFEQVILKEAPASKGV